MSRILAVTNMYPTPEMPYLGIHVAQRVRAIQHAGHVVEVLSIDRMSGGMRAYRGLTDRIRGAIRTSAPDILHVMYGGVIAEVATRLHHDIPTVVSYCGTDLLGCPVWSLGSLVTWNYGVLASHVAARRAQGIVVMSRNLQQALRPSARRKAAIIPDPLDLSLFQPMDQSECQQRLGWDAAAKHVLFLAGSTNPLKRFDLTQKAVRLVQEAGREVRLHALDEVAHHLVPCMINASDVTILTSHHEGSPNVIRESLACNVPVVAVDVGDIADQIAGIEGCFVTSDHPADIAQKLAQALARGGRVDSREKMGRYGLDRIGDAHSAVYATVLGTALRRPQEVGTFVATLP